MEVNNKSTRIHPLVATAAVSVTLASLVGMAAITGVLPSSHSSNPPAVAAAPAPAVTAPALAAVAPVSPPADSKLAANTVAAEKPAAVKKPAPVKRHHATHAVAAAPSYAPNPASYQAPVAQAPVCYNCGQVESVEAARQPAQASGVGAVAGAVLGGVLGNQVGAGNGKALATVAGAVGGGFAGNAVEKHTRASTTYHVRVRMEDGSVRTFPQTADSWRAGDRVRVVNGTLSAQG